MARRHDQSRGNQRSCTLEFDGSSRGNPGRAGAGAILRAEDGSKICSVRQGLGNQTGNAAEYEGLNLGMKQAIRLGYEHIRVQGDSRLVYNQVQGNWKVNSPNLSGLCNEAKELKNQFTSFSMDYTPREYNTEADYQAKQAANLPAGRVEEDRDY